LSMQVTLKLLKFLGATIRFPKLRIFVLNIWNLIISKALWIFVLNFQNTWIKNKVPYIGCWVKDLT
jgi:hypothetical protein